MNKLNCSLEIDLVMPKETIPAAILNMLLGIKNKNGD